MPSDDSPIAALLRQSELAGARAILEQHPELLTEATIAVIRTVAARIADRRARERLGAIERLVDQARAVGIEQAFEAVSIAPPRQLHAFELMQIGSEFLAEADDAHACALLESYPEIPLDAVRVMATSAMRLSSDEERRRLERRIEILNRWPMVRLARAVQRAQAAEAAFRVRRDLGTLRERARLSDEAAEAALGAPVDAAMRGSMCVHAMQLQFSVWANTYDGGALDRAIARGLDAEREQPGSAADMLCSALTQRYEVQSTSEDLDRVVAILDPLLPGDLVPADDERVGAMATTLANALRHRYMATRDIEDLQRAIRLYEQLVVVAGADEGRQRVRQLNLSAGLATRYDSVGDLHDLGRAIDIMRAVSVSSADDDPVKPTVENDLGLALLKRFGVTGNRQDLADALGAATASVRLLPPGAPDGPRNLTNAGVCFLTAYRELKQPGMLKAAIDALLHVVATMPDDIAEAGRPLQMASEALLERFAIEPEREDIDRAVELARRGADVTTVASALRGGALGQLADALRRRSASPFAQPGDGAEAIARYREAVAVSVSESAPLGVEQSLEWAGWARQRGEWAEAAEALLAGLDAHRRLFESQQDRTAKELRLKRVQGLAAVAADSLMRAGELAEAVVTLERGRALLMAEALHQAPAAVTFAAIASARPDVPIVYLEDVDGGYALIVHHGTVRALELPELREETVNTWLGANMQLREEDPAAWDQQLTGLCRWLWDAAIGPLIDALHPATRMLLVPGGYLGMLPLHAAWKDDSTTPSGRFHAIDAVTIHYAPRLGALRTDSANPLRSVLCVDEPKPVNAPALPFSKTEVTTIATLFEAKTVLRGRKATAAALLEEVAAHDVVHLSCHGAASLDEPLENGVLLAGDTFLTLRELLGHRLDTVMLAVLSACDTGQMGARLPDEAIGLPAGLLQAGVRSVVSPLWPVDSWSTLLLLLRFYEMVQRDGLDVPDALASAQRWLRDTTNAEKAAHFTRVAAIRRELLLREPELREQAAIAEWAPFACCGG